MRIDVPPALRAEVRYDETRTAMPIRSLRAASTGARDEPLDENRTART
jgi:hypothetical protein